MALPVLPEICPVATEQFAELELSCLPGLCLRAGSPSTAFSTRAPAMSCYPSPEREFAKGRRRASLAWMVQRTTCFGAVALADDFGRPTFCRVNASSDGNPSSTLSCNGPR